MCCAVLCYTVVSYAVVCHDVRVSVSEKHTHVIVMQAKLQRMLSCKHSLCGESHFSLMRQRFCAVVSGVPASPRCHGFVPAVRQSQIN